MLGTVLGLFAIVILQNGLRLSGQPAELAGILTGVLLVATILLDRLSRHKATPRVHISQQEDEVRNSQVATLSAVILVAALMVVGGNWWLVRSLRSESSGAAPRGSSVSQTAAGRKPVIALMPKAKGDPLFHQLPARR